MSRWLAIAVVIVACADHPPRSHVPVHDEDLSIGPSSTKVDATLADTQWSYCNQPKYGVSFRANGTLAITTASADSCDWGQWTQDGANVSFVCNNYWHWTGSRRHV